MEEKEIIVCEKCGNKVHPATLKSNEQYPELEGKPYCKDCRDDVLKECGEYNCMGCGEIVSKKVRDFTLSKFDKVLCYNCQKKEQKGELEVTSVPAIVPEVVNSAIVRPALSPNDSLSAWHAFQDLKGKIKSSNDVTTIRGKEYLGKSFWRKMATFFNLTDEILDRKFEYNDRGFIQSAYYEIKMIAPNGRSTTGIGFCSAKEREFAHPDHDIRATAHTRAKNRGISDMIAGGEVSAEEISLDNLTSGD